MMTAYLNAVKALDDDRDGKAIVDRMKATPVDNLYARGGKIREDGRLIKDMYLAQVKAPADVKADWDLYSIVETVSGERAFKPAAESDCPLLKR